MVKETTPTSPRFNSDSHSLHFFKVHIGEPMSLLRGHWGAWMTQEQLHWKIFTQHAWGCPHSYMDEFPAPCFFSAYILLKSIRVCVCDEDKWLAGRRGWALRWEASDLLTPSFAEGTLALQETTCRGLFLISRHRQSWKDSHLTYTAVLCNTTLRKATPNYTHKVM